MAAELMMCQHRVVLAVNGMRTRARDGTDDREPEGGGAA